jgi:hypothetical protein
MLEVTSARKTMSGFGGIAGVSTTFGTVVLLPDVIVAVKLDDPA